MKMIFDTSKIDNKDFEFLTGATVISVKMLAGGPYIEHIQIVTDKGVVIVDLNSDGCSENWDKVVINNFKEG